MTQSINHDAAIRAAIQAMLDAQPDASYQCCEIVIAMGLERLGRDGLEAIPWVWSPDEQAVWKTRALLHEALDLQAERLEAD